MPNKYNNKGNECNEQILNKLEEVIKKLIAQNPDRDFLQTAKEAIGFKDMCVPFEQRKMYLSALGKRFGERGGQEAARRRELCERARGMNK